MSYNTNYELEVTNLKGDTEKKEVSIDSIQEDVANGMTKAMIIERLELLKEGFVEVDDLYIINQLRKENSEAAYSLDSSGDTRDASRWYESANDLKEFSKKYPNWLFTLKGRGEENGDIWSLYTVNGKQQLEKAHIVIDPYDENKLK